MGSLEIINRDKTGKIKKDIHISRTLKEGKTIKEDTLKQLEEKELEEKNERQRI